jgi:pyruvate kinase
MHPVKPRRTKIIATLGPATDDKTVLQALLKAGVDLVRLNFSHGTQEQQLTRIQQVREISQQMDKEIGILADLQGPKIRIARFKTGSAELKNNADFCLDPELPDDAGDDHTVGVAYKALPDDVKPNDILLLDDGLIELRVNHIMGRKIHCRVQSGGILLNNKGINRQGGGLTAPALTDKDRADLKFAVQHGVDYIAVSFPRNADDIKLARDLIHAAKGSSGIIAKIERTEAVANIDEIIHVSDAVMVARGDLAIEIGYAELPAVQKDIIHKARTFNKAVITATQMLESMIHHVVPTRAEVSDVANAIIDGTDAVMFSAETASGQYPVKVIETAHAICVGAEKQSVTQVSRHRVECSFTRVDEAIAMATMYTANHFDIRAIIALTESGSTPLWMSRIRSGIPIFGLSRHETTRRKMTLYRGVYPISFDATQFPRTHLNKEAIISLKKRGLLQAEDSIIITKGDSVGIHGRTNSMKILRVADLS